jgi:RNA polymerase sigma-70 factor (ECF subfamily)
VGRQAGIKAVPTLAHPTLPGEEPMLMQFCAFDEDYLERLRQRDPETQKHFAAYFSELIRLKAGKYLHSASAAEDVRQETFARVLAALHNQNGIRQPERLGAFVNAVCNNVLREYHRSACRQVPIDEEAATRFIDSSNAILDHVASRQQQRRVRQILDDLSDKDRRIIQAVFLEERDKDEVCRDLGVNRDYLRVLLCRAKQAFKALYLRKTRVPSRPGLRACQATSF